MNTNSKFEVDFVILWVDGNDPDWRKELIEARRNANRDSDSSEIRFRDWENLKYWFRGVESFAPWVRRIHFITWGHLPKWLDTSHPKLNIVRHEDILKEEYRPTFNSNVIELNIHRIEGLAEHFVLFNDDTFLCHENSIDDYFSKEGLPRDMARLSLVQPSSVGHTIYNVLSLINTRYPRKEINRNIWKWINLKYGLSNILKSLTLLPWSSFPGFYDHHMPQAYLKSRFEEAWGVWHKELERACHNHLRELSDLSHWLIRYDTLVRGDFSPRRFSDCRLFTLDDGSLEEICSAISEKRYRMLCLNDGENISNFEQCKERVINSFNAILPTASSYEKL